MSPGLEGNVKQLYDLGEVWLKGLWNRKGCTIVKIETERKTLGRNQGFVFVVIVQSPNGEMAIYRYYAKVEEYFESEIISVHHFLKSLGVLPVGEMYFTTLNIPGSYNDMLFGMIVPEVTEFYMASFGLWFCRESVCPEQETKLIKTDAFLMTFIRFVCGLKRIPGNWDNWGLIRDSNVPFRFRLIDFSFAEPPEEYIYQSYESPVVFGMVFEHVWRETSCEVIPKSRQFITPADGYHLTDANRCQLRCKFPWLKEDCVLKMLDEANGKFRDWWDVADTVHNSAPSPPAPSPSPTPVVVVRSPHRSTVKRSHRRSKRIAKLRKRLLGQTQTTTPPVMQSAEPYHSEEHITQHKAWKLSAEQNRKYAVLRILSSDNIDAMKKRVRAFFAWFDGKGGPALDDEIMKDVMRGLSGLSACGHY